MSRQRTNRRVLMVSVAVAGLMVVRSPCAEAEEPPLPDPAIITAWEKAGAVFGWMDVDRDGILSFYYAGGPVAGHAADFTFLHYYSPYRLAPEAGDLPAFRFYHFPQKTIPGLPAPEVPFGLFFENGPVDLKELASLKQLRMLHSAAGLGLKELAAREQLQSLTYHALKDEDFNELTSLPRLKSLNLSFANNPTEAGSKELSKLPQLETLNLSLNSPYKRIDSDAALRLLANAWSARKEPPLRTLSLSLFSTHITGAGLKELVGMKQAGLTLGLSSNRLTNVDFKELAALKQLRSLDLKFTNVTDADLRELARLNRLQELDLGFTQVTDAGLGELSGLKQLRTLSLISTKVTDMGVKELVHLKELQDLSLQSTLVTGACLKDLSGLRQLKSLNLLATKVTDADLEQLAGMKLASLNFAPKTDLALQYYLAAIKPPEVVVLEFWQISDAGLKELAGQKQLRVLDLFCTPITDAGLKELSGLEQLHFLDLTGTRVTDAGLKELAGLKRLLALYLHSTQVSDSSLKELAGLKELRALGVASTKVTETGASELRKHLPGIIISGLTTGKGDASEVQPRSSTEGGRAPLGKSAQVRTPPLLAEIGTRQLIFSRDGKTLLSLATDSSQLWDVRTGKLLRKYEDFPPRRFGELPLALPFEVSPDARLVALGSGEDQALLVREVATGKEVSRLKGRVEDEMMNVSMSFSPDGRLLALGGYPGNIHVWETSSSKELYLLRWRNLDHSAITFSLDGKILAAGSKDGQIGLWEVAGGKKIRSMKAYKEYQPVVKLAFSADGKMLVSDGLNGTFRLWEVASGKQLLEIPEEEYVFDVSFSPNSRLLASSGADNIIRLRELASGKQKRLEGHSEMITAVAFSPDGKSLASASRDLTLRLWDVDTGKERFRHKQPSEVVECLVFSPDGKILASVPGPDGKIQFWDPASGKEIVK